MFRFSNWVAYIGPYSPKNILCGVTVSKNLHYILSVADVTLILFLIYVFLWLCSNIIRYRTIVGNRIAKKDDSRQFYITEKTSQYSELPIILF